MPCGRDVIRVSGVLALGVLEDSLSDRFGQDRGGSIKSSTGELAERPGHDVVVTEVRGCSDDGLLGSSDSGGGDVRHDAAATCHGRHLGP